MSQPTCFRPAMVEEIIWTLEGGSNRRPEKCITKKIMIFTSHQFNKNQMGGACGTYDAKERERERERERGGREGGREGGRHSAF